METKPVGRKDRHKPTRKRLDQVNEAARRCRQRQKAQLLYLRQRVIELEGKLNLNHKEAETKNAETTYASESSDELNIINHELDRQLQNHEQSPHAFHLLTLIEKVAPLINQIQVHTSVLKEQLGHYFVYANVFYHSGFHIQPLITEKSTSFYMTKFFPHATLKVCEGTLTEILCSAEKHQYDQILEVMNENAVIGVISRLHEERLLNIPVLMMKWMDENQVIFSSETIPTILPCDDLGLRSYSARTWFAKHVVNDISGIYVTRYVMYNHSISKENSNALIQVKEKVIDEECCMLEAFDQSVVKKISTIQTIQQQQQQQQQQLYLLNKSS